ncbi:hypothetical protein V6N13_059706 [Hibiscus sabdariffa]
MLCSLPHPHWLPLVQLSPQYVQALSAGQVRASQDWLSRYQFFQVTSSFTTKSDHYLLLTDTSPITDTGKVCNRDDYFHYDNRWIAETDCLDRVHTTWQYMSSTTIDKLHAVGGALKNWQNERHNARTKCIKELRGFHDKCMQRRMTASE